MRRKGLWIGVAIALVLLLGVGAGLLALYARGGGELPGFLSFLGPPKAGYLDPSTPEEAVLRTLRLAGYERAVVGEEGGTAVLRLETPAVTSPADVELAWQTGAATLAGGYPSAATYVVQVFSPEAQPLVEVTVPGSDARSAVSADDAAALREAADFRYLLEGTGG